MAESETVLRSVRSVTHLTVSSRNLWMGWEKGFVGLNPQVGVLRAGAISPNRLRPGRSNLEVGGVSGAAGEVGDTGARAEGDVLGQRLYHRGRPPPGR